MKYVDLKYRPGKNEVIAEYFVEPNKISLEKACEHLAGESSIGTWTSVGTMKPRISLMRPHVFSINKKERVFKIAYPPELFEPGNVPQLMSSIGGNVFGMKAVKNLRLLDIRLPERYVRSFRGPKFGIEGVRKKLRVRKRPLLGTIVKPKLGLNEREHAKSAYESWVGGMDIVKDDENLTSMSFNKFERRVEETLRMREKAEDKTGEGKFYMPNVTGETHEMMRRANFVRKHRGEYVMIDILTTGWSGLQTLRNYNDHFSLIIHAHRAGHGALTKNPKHGISMVVIGKLARLIGVDQIHVGTAKVGKMGDFETPEVEDEVESRFVTEGKHVLEQFWFDVKPVFAVASGGLHPGSIPKLLKRMGTNIIIQAGGGVHGHPKGSEAGAKSMRQSLEAVMKGIPLREYAKNNKELSEAIDKWGVV